MSTNLGPPPKFLVQYPQTEADWSQFIRWLFQMFQTTQAAASSQQASLMQTLPYPDRSFDEALIAANLAGPIYPQVMDDEDPPLAPVPVARVPDALPVANQMPRLMPSELTGLMALALGKPPYFYNNGNSGGGSSSPTVLQTLNVTLVSTAYTVLATDFFVEGNANSAPFTISLPATATDNQIFVIGKNDFSNNILTVSGNGHDIEGLTTWALRQAGNAIMVQWDGFQWSLLSHEDGRLTGNRTSVSANYSVLPSDFLVEGNAAGGAITLTLPSSGVNGVPLFAFKKTDSSGNAVTVGGGGSTIDGASTFVLHNQYDAVILQFDGTQWATLAKPAPTGGGSTTLNLNVTLVSATYSVLTTDFFIEGNATGGAFTITLPASPTPNQLFAIGKVDFSANAITVAGGGGHNVGGLSTWTLRLQNNAILVQWDGSQWSILSLFEATFRPAYTLVGSSATYFVLPSDFLIDVDVSGGTSDIALPTSFAGNLTIAVKKSDISNNTVILNGNGNTIDGSSTLLLSSQYDMIICQWDGAEWVTWVKCPQPWISFTTTVTPLGGMTFSASTNNCRYYRYGKLCYFTLEVAGTIGGTLGPDFHFSVPVSGQGSFPYALTAAIVDGGGVTWAGLAVVSGAVLGVTKSDSSNFTAGTGTFIINGVYETA